MMSEKRLRINADVCACASEDNSKLVLEASIPGVRKEDIRLRMVEDGFFLSAPKKDMEYVHSAAFCCPVIPRKAKATYTDGCLKIEVPFRSMDSEPVKIAVQ